jgi:dCTP diphosphatase
VNFSISNDTIKKLLEFRATRKWEKFHTPENLAKSIVIEAAELLERFQWGGQKPVADEVADVLIYLIYFCEYYGFDIDALINAKIKINEANYPAEKNNGVCIKEH